MYLCFDCWLACCWAQMLPQRWDATGQKPHHNKIQMWQNSWAPLAVDWSLQIPIWNDMRLSCYMINRCAAIINKIQSQQSTRAEDHQTLGSRKNRKIAVSKWTKYVKELRLPGYHGKYLVDLLHHLSLYSVCSLKNILFKAAVTCKVPLLWSRNNA